MKHNITILRIPDLSFAAPRRGPTRGPALESAVAQSGGSVAIESARGVSSAELADLRRDPTVMVATPNMPMKLIEPFEGTGAAAHPQVAAVHRMRGSAGSPPVTAQEDENATWGIQAVGADRSPFNGEGIIVAVLDTGIDAAHPAFAGVDLVQKDFTGSGGVDDSNGHGTHCAGTIFGRDLDGLRIGVAPGVKKALIGKVLGGPQGGGSGELAQAMQWAADNGASVISMSLGIDFPGFVNSLVLSEGIPIPAATSMALEAYRTNVLLFEKLVNFFNARAAFGQSVLVVAATGNESEREAPNPYTINLSPPAAAPGIMGVAALGQNGTTLKIARFSNTGALLAAPGVDIKSAWPGGRTNTISGTSMATPHVAGVAALWAQRLSANDPVSPVVLQARLIASATAVPGLAAADVGSGLVQAPQS